MDIFESLENLNVSEECFEDIVNIVEDILNETKKANKIAHQEAIFKKLSPQGRQRIYFDERDLTPKGKEALKNLTHVNKYGPDDTFMDGVAHSLQDSRKVLDTDSKRSAPYSDGVYDNIKTDNALYVRGVLGRNDEFSNKPIKPSKSHQAAELYNQFKNKVKELKKSDN